MKKSKASQSYTRRQVLTAAVIGGVGVTAAGFSPFSLAQATDAVPLDVYKDPTCGCCANWIGHMEAAGFAPTVYHPRNLNAVKLEHGIRGQLQSCHTAVTAEGYVFEGHVPAKFVQQFLANPPANAKGLTVPGMPMGSPGMEMGGRFDPYDVIQLNQDGSTSVFASVNGADEQY